MVVLIRVGLSKVVPQLGFLIRLSEDVIERIMCGSKDDYSGINETLYTSFPFPQLTNIISPKTQSILTQPTPKTKNTRRVLCISIIYIPLCTTHVMHPKGTVDIPIHI